MKINIIIYSCRYILLHSTQQLCIAFPFHSNIFFSNFSFEAYNIKLQWTISIYLNLIVSSNCVSFMRFFHSILKYILHLILHNICIYIDKCMCPWWNVSVNIIYIFLYSFKPKTIYFEKKSFEIILH